MSKRKRKKIKRKTSRQVEHRRPRCFCRRQIPATVFIPYVYNTRFRQQRQRKKKRFRCFTQNCLRSLQTFDGWLAAAAGFFSLHIPFICLLSIRASIRFELLKAAATAPFIRKLPVVIWHLSNSMQS